MAGASSADRGEILTYVLLMIRSFIVSEAAGFRIQYANESALQNNTVFTTIGTYASYAIAFVGVVLFAAHTEPMREVPRTILNFIGSFSAFLGPFSYLMVIVLPPKLNWIGYVVAFLVFGVLVACFYLFDHQQDKRPASAFGEYAFICVVMFSWASIILPTSDYDWILYPVIYVCLWVEVADHVITYLMFIYQKTRKPETYPLIQQDQNNTGPPFPSYIMQFRSSSPSLM